MKLKGLSNTLLWLLGLVVMLSSCNGVEEMVAYDTHNVTFSLSADGEEATRSSAAVTRYVMAIYDESGENKVVSEKEFDSNTFSVRLDAGKYTCLFWADHGSANYDAADLTAITAKANSADDANAEAFYAKQGITVTNGGVVDVTLRRAVAQAVHDVVGKRYKSIRYGGDEIIVLAEGEDINGFESQIDAVKDRLEAIRKASAKSYRMSISYGFAYYPQGNSTTFSELIEEADFNMYEHKKQKRAARQQALTDATR